MNAILDWLKQNWSSLGPVITAFLGSAGYLLNRRLSRTNARAEVAKTKAETAAANASAMADDVTTLRNLVGTYREEFETQTKIHREQIAELHKSIAELSDKQVALEAHIADLYVSIGAEAADVAARIFGRLVTKRPNGKHAGA